jgi:enoyl-CoA hydratase/3-hydroxyacyl-CoA dehydrogenase
MTIYGINKIAVIGAGIMGHGIAQLFSMQGYQINLVDTNEPIIKEALEKTGWSLDKFVEAGQLGKKSGKGFYNY